MTKPKISPLAAIQNRLDEVDLLIKNNSSQQLYSLNFFVAGSCITHALLESLGKVEQWRPNDLDLFFGEPQPKVDSLMNELRKNKKINVSDNTSEYEDLQASQSYDSFVLNTYTIRTPINMIQNYSYAGRSRSSLRDSIFNRFDMALNCAVYDPFEKTVTSTNLAKESIERKQIILNPFFMETYDTLLTMYGSYEKTKESLSESSFQNLAYKALLTLQRVKKYKDRGFNIDEKETVNHLRVLREFSNDFKRDVQ